MAYNVLNRASRLTPVDAVVVGDISGWRGGKARRVVRQMEHEGELIWLRQSATFTVNGQTRTVEIAVPVRPDAPAEEVEALMSQANVGMDALTRELDRRITALLAGEKPQAAVTDAAHAPIAPVAPAAPPATPAAPAPAMPTASTPSAPAPAAQPPAAAPAEAPLQAPRPAAAAPARPQSPQTATQQPSTPPARAGASGSLRPQPPAPASAEPRKTAPAAPAGPDISRAEFISATAEMGLNPGQAMERLGVRSLQGLNLREALEALRRQLVRDGGDAPATPTPATPPTQGSRPAQATRATSSASVAPALGAGRREAAQSQPPRYFEEEDDMEAIDFTFTMDGDADNEFYDEFGAAVGEDTAGYSAGSQDGASGDFGALDDLDDLDLDDVPDFGPPPTPARAAPAAPAAPPQPAPQPTTARRGTSQASVATPDEAGDVADASPATEGRSLGMQRIGYFRSVRGGGAPTGQQRMAYRNIVVRELGDGDARALVQGIWRVTPDRLGSEQLDALVSWGKRDTFAEEAALVLAVLQEERERNENAASASDDPAEAAPSPATPRASGTRTEAAAAAQRPAPRTRTAATRTTQQAGDA